MTNKTILKYTILLFAFSFFSCSSEERRPEGKGFFQQVLGLFSGKAHQEKEGWIVRQNGGDSSPKDVQEFLERARKAGLDLKSTDGEVQRCGCPGKEVNTSHNIQTKPVSRRPLHGETKHDVKRPGNSDMDGRFPGPCGGAQRIPDREELRLTP